MKRIIFSAIAAFSCTAVLAAEPSSYVSASIGSAEQKLSVEGFSVTESDTALQITGGHRFTPNVGVELGYTNFGKAEVSAMGLTASSKPRAFHLAVTGAWNATSEFAVTGKLGAARTRTKLKASDAVSSESLTESRTSLMFGVGVSYSYGPNAALIAEYQNFGKIIKEDGADLKAHVISAGIRYTF